MTDPETTSSQRKAMIVALVCVAGPLLLGMVSPVSMIVTVPLSGICGAFLITHSIPPPTIRCIAMTIRFMLITLLLAVVLCLVLITIAFAGCAVATNCIRL